MADQTAHGMLTFASEDYRTLELFVEATDRDHPATVRLVPAGGRTAAGDRTATLPTTRRFGRLVLPVDRGRTYALSWSHSRLALAYLSGCDDLLEEGVRVLPVPDPKAAGGMVRSRLHLTPPSGSLVGAGVPVRFQGRWHVFYPFDPYGPSRGQTQWGHAVSLDLVHWADLPVFLLPRPQGQEWDATVNGGAFSGRAIPVDADGRPCAGDDAAALKIFLTPSAGRSAHPMTLLCKNGLTPGQGTALCDDGRALSPTDPGSPTDTGSLTNLTSQTDPDVHGMDVDIPPDGPATMVAATAMPASSLPLEHQPGRSDEADAVRSDGRHGWYATGPYSVPGEDAPQGADADMLPALASFVNPDPALAEDRWMPTGAALMEDGLGHAGAFEDPDLFVLDGGGVAIAGLTRYRDGMGGRFRPIRWYIGDPRRGRRVNGVRAPRLLVRSAGWLDFGPSLAAVRTFADPDRRLMVGQVSDFLCRGGVSVGRTGGALTLPRQLRVRDDRLWQHPATEVYAHALGDILTQANVPDLPDSPVRRRIRLDIPDNAYYADIRLVDAEHSDDVDLLLAGWDDGGTKGSAERSAQPAVHGGSEGVSRPETRSGARPDEAHSDNGSDNGIHPKAASEAPGSGGPTTDGPADLSGLGIRPDHWLSLSDCDQGFEDGLTRFVTRGLQKMASIDPVSDIGRGSLRRIEVFYDRGIAEVFLNDGQAAGTIAVPDPRTVRGCFEAVLPRGALLTLRILRGRDRD